MKGSLTRAGGALIGLLVGVIYLMWLMDLNVISVGLNWGPAYGMGWIPVVLLISPTVGALLVDGRENLATVLLLLIVLALPPVVSLTGQFTKNAALAKEKQVLAQWEAEAAAAVRAVAGEAEVLAENPDGRTECDKVLVWAGGAAGGTWYWYDVSTHRMIGSASEARIAELVSRYLRPGDRVGPLTPVAGHPKDITFTVYYPEGTGRGTLHLAVGCRFTFNSIDFRDPPPGVQMLDAPFLEL